MKTIVQVVQHLSPGGLEVMALEFMNFSKFRHDMKIVSLEGDRASAIAAWPKLEAYQDKLVFLNKPNGLSLSLISTLSNLLKHAEADVVHTHHIGPFFYGGLAARLAGIPHLHTEHDAWHYNNVKHRLIHRIVSLVANPIEVADADVVANNMTALSGTRDLRVIRNGIDTDRFVPGDKSAAREALILPKNVLLIGASGRLEDVKGHHVLITAMRSLPRHIHLAIAGCGSLEQELKRQVRQQGLSDRVHFLGYTENMPQFYQALDLFCLPSFNEGFPLAPLEAQACNIRSAVTNVGGAKETLCPQTGTLLTVGEPMTMSKEILAALSHPPNESPRHFVKANADVRCMARAYDSLAEGLCYEL